MTITEVTSPTMKETKKLISKIESGFLENFLELFNRYEKVELSEPRIFFKKYEKGRSSLFSTIFDRSYEGDVETLEFKLTNNQGKDKGSIHINTFNPQNEIYDKIKYVLDCESSWDKEGIWVDKYLVKREYKFWGELPLQKTNSISGKFLDNEFETKKTSFRVIETHNLTMCCMLIQSGVYEIIREIKDFKRVGAYMRLFPGLDNCCIDKILLIDDVTGEWYNDTSSQLRQWRGIRKLTEEGNLLVPPTKSYMEQTREFYTRTIFGIVD